ncbi:hypothetical protein Sru01_20970 [Sphaerisporangium rufum]|uniref:SRPBCC domain-containing protein n=1 Tax=Sphaerisporangium rufum TaxID=1381558 RepID=A0A919V4C2_9ACTN|nr:SRPBCC domain-containing protein [Sphaerisporangium rufum]GII77115.1 hypothetical protein Sru01_20970 [Sphaerisporangium rufum]
MTQPFESRRQFELRGALEQAWEAIAAGTALDAWLPGPDDALSGAAGRARRFFGVLPADTVVATWRTGDRLAYRGADDGARAGSGFDFLVEEHGEGGNMLRLVQSGVLGGDWRTEYEALNRGWDMYLHTLDQYLTHFPGRFALVVYPVRPRPGRHEPVGETLRRGLGLTGPVVQGDRVRLTPDGPGPIEGVADQVAPGLLGVRTGEALYRFAEGPLDTVVVTHHIFTEQGEPAEAERAWLAWLDGLFG